MKAEEKEEEGRFYNNGAKEGEAEEATYQNVLSGLQVWLRATHLQACTMVDGTARMPDMVRYCPQDGACRRCRRSIGVRREAAKVRSLELGASQVFWIRVAWRGTGPELCMRWFQAAITGAFTEFFKRPSKWFGQPAKQGACLEASHTWPFACPLEVYRNFTGSRGMLAWWVHSLNRRLYFCGQAAKKQLEFSSQETTATLLDFI